MSSFTETDSSDSQESDQDVPILVKEKKEARSKSNQGTSTQSKPNQGIPTRLKSNQGVPTLTKRQRDTRSNLIAKNLNFNLPIKLNQNNFVYWKAQILPIVRAFDLEEFLYGPIKSPQKYVEVEDDETGELIRVVSDDFLNWKKVDQLLVGWMLSTLNESILGQVTQCITACELWNSIITLFSQSSMARTMHLRNQLQVLKKGAMSISEFVVKIRGIADSLTSSGQIITEYDLVSYVLQGLGQEYDPVVSTITAKEGNITMQQAQFLLMSFESRLEQFASIPGDLQNASANVHMKTQRNDPSSTQRGGQNRGRGRGRFNSRGRGGARFNNTRPVCQVCSKIGHTANVCYHRFDQTYTGTSFRQPPPQGNVAHQTEYSNDIPYQVHNNSHNAMTASSSSVADPSWYVDSGATNHITNDFNNLSISHEYKGQSNEESVASRCS